MKLFFRSFGSGPVLFIIHGLFGLSDNWVTLGKRFAERFRVVVPDLRNHGRSPHSSLFDLPSMEEDILELMEEVGGGPVLLMGHSLGGRVAVSLSLHHPDLVRKLVIVDISLRKYPPRSDHLKLIEAMQAVDLVGAGSRSEAESRLRSHVSVPRVRQFLLKNLYWRERGRLAWRINLPVISRSLPALFEGAEVRGIFPHPALFLRGELSDYILDDDLPLIYRQFPGATVTTVSGATHWVHADRPGEFFRVVSSFLES